MQLNGNLRTQAHARRMRLVSLRNGLQFSVFFWEIWIKNWQNGHWPAGRWVPFLKQLLLRNCAGDFVEICNVYVGKMIIKAAKSIFNSDKMCRSYSDLYFGVTFLEHSV